MYRKLGVVSVVMLLTACSETSNKSYLPTATSTKANKERKVILHDESKAFFNGMAPVAFKDTIQGVRINEMECEFPGAEKKDRRGYVMTIGEYDRDTCIGVVYSGKWFDYFRQSFNSKNPNVISDTVRVKKLGQSNVAAMVDECTGVPNNYGTVIAYRWKSENTPNSDTPRFQAVLQADVVWQTHYTEPCIELVASSGVIRSVLQTQNNPWQLGAGLPIVNPVFMKWGFNKSVGFAAWDVDFRRNCGGWENSRWGGGSLTPMIIAVAILDPYPGNYSTIDGDASPGDPALPNTRNFCFNDYDYTDYWSGAEW